MNFDITENCSLLKQVSPLRRRRMRGIITGYSWLRSLEMVASCLMKEIGANVVNMLRNE